MKTQLVFSCNTTGNGEIARSNKNFLNKVKSQQFFTKGDIVKQKLEKLFN